MAIGTGTGSLKRTLSDKSPRRVPGALSSTLEKESPGVPRDLQEKGGDRCASGALFHRLPGKALGLVEFLLRQPRVAQGAEAVADQPVQGAEER